ncbi:hypothetical protein GCM10009831_25160 [Dietzia cercidiphylli]|uniref:Uncharacterized protein n=1 Tax=Dietzia cercidiphylli TaxID=498199 RepID=A0ABP4V381_9ACTN
MSAAGTPTPAYRASPHRAESRVVTPAATRAARRILVVRPVANRGARWNPVAIGPPPPAGTNPARSPSPSPPRSGPGTRDGRERAATPVVTRAATRPGHDPACGTPAGNRSTRAIPGPPDGRRGRGTGPHAIAAPAGHPVDGASARCGSWVWCSW